MALKEFTHNTDTDSLNQKIAEMDLYAFQSKEFQNDSFSFDPKDKVRVHDLKQQRDESERERVIRNHLKINADITNIDVQLRNLTLFKN